MKDISLKLEPISSGLFSEFGQIIHETRVDEFVSINRGYTKKFATDTVIDTDERPAHHCLKVVWYESVSKQRHVICIVAFGEEPCAKTTNGHVRKAIEIVDDDAMFSGQCILIVRGQFLLRWWQDGGVRVVYQV